MATRVLNLNVQQNMMLIKRPRVKSPLRNKHMARKVLFGPVDREETNQIFLAQIQLHQRNAAERWNYDFVKDRPIVSADSKYMWERVPPVNSGLSALVGLTGGQAGPSVITLSNAAHVREVVGPAPDVDRVPAPSSPNSSSASDSDLLMDSRADLSLDIDQNSIGSNAKRVKAEQVVVAVAGSSGTGPTCCTRQLRQKKMTDYCKEKKRTSAVLSSVVSKKEMGLSPRCSPSKRSHSTMSRSNSSPSSSSTSTSCSSSAPVAGSSSQSSTSSSSSSDAVSPPAKRIRSDSHC